MSDDLIKKLAAKAHRLYEGKETPHRSCGICLAETFGKNTTPYQVLRKGGLTGKGFCGAIQAGLMILGEIFGDPDPAGKVTEELKQAAQIYTKLYEDLVNKGKSPSFICNDLISQFDDFHSEERLLFCTNISETVAFCVAKTLQKMGREDLLREALS